MRKSIIVCIVLSFSGGCSGESETEYATITDRQKTPPKMPTEANRALERIDRLELVALNPDVGKLDSAKQGFVGWAMLGTTLLKERDDQTRIVSAFRTGVEESDGSGEACFRPRHAIRIHSEGVVHDFLISFECSQVQWFVNQENPKGIRITNTPRTVFDEVLKEGKVRVPRQPNR